MTGGAQGRAEFLCGGVEIGGVGAAVLPGEVHVADFVDGGQVQVQVGDFKARAHEADLGAGEGRLDAAGYFLGGREEVSREVIRGVDPVIDFVAGDHEGMARADRGDGEEGDAAVILPDETAGNFSIDDAGEERSHEVVRRGFGDLD